MKFVGFKFLSLVTLGVIIGGCSSYTEETVSQTFQPAEAPSVLAKATNTSGAIFQPGRSGLFATDQRARRDRILVRVGGVGSRRSEGVACACRAWTCRADRGADTDA